MDTKNVSDVTKDSLISLMCGREMSDIYNIEHFIPGEELLRIENFSDGESFDNIGFSLHKGEILGFFGLVGAGRSEVMMALNGASKRASGDVYLNGEKVSIKNPTEALKTASDF